MSRKPPEYDTGEICLDLPSPYLPHQATGLLHLPRFLAKIRKDLAGELPKSYQRNYRRGFDGFLCAHLGIEAEQVVALVREAKDEAELEARLLELFPEDLKVAKWNRELVQKGLSQMGRETLEATRQKMGIADRTDLLTFADMIDFDEDRID